MNTIDFFCGSKSVANVFEELGHKVITVDIDFGFSPDICVDIMNFDSSSLPAGYKCDVIWASPPCESFSVATIGRNWNRDYTPKTDKARLAMAWILKTISIIDDINPRYYFIENPMGMLRKMPFMAELPRKTVTYCQYGDTRRKATDIWTNCEAWTPRPMCKNGDSCHEAAPRGSRTGTQGLANRIERSKIPRELMIEIAGVVS